MKNIFISAAVVSVLICPRADGRDHVAIDVSAGASAERYPVRALSVPAVGWGEDVKTSHIVLVRIPAGSFVSPGGVKTTVSKPFYMGVFEVTQRQFESVTGGNPSLHRSALHPVENVSYGMIRGEKTGAAFPASADVDEGSFIGLLRKKTGLRTLDLPTEAEWELASGGEKLPEGGLDAVARHFGNCLADGEDVPHAVVGSYAPNGSGLYDMYGNVWEWCLDWMDARRGGADPVGPDSGTLRVLRGGAWTCGELGCASTFRYGYSPVYGTRDCMGFRIRVSADSVDELLKRR